MLRICSSATISGREVKNLWKMYLTNLLECLTIELKNGVVEKTALEKFASRICWSATRYLWKESKEFKENAFEGLFVVFDC